MGARTLTVVNTPGHTDGRIGFLMNDPSAVLTGNSLLVRGCGRTDFQQDSTQTLFHSIKDRLFELPDDCIAYSAYDYSGRTASTMGEEKQLNPRIGGQTNENDFVGCLEDMEWPHSKGSGHQIKVTSGLVTVNITSTWLTMRSNLIK